MTRSDPLLTKDELSMAADAWLPTSDPATRDTIVALLEQVAATGADPMATLRDGMGRWFGARSSIALPPRTNRAKAASEGQLVLEPLYTLRRPTLWPQRPKRVSDELFSSWLWRAAIAANVPPRVFAKQVVGRDVVDIDRDIDTITLRRLAHLTGQTVGHLAGGLLQLIPEVAYDAQSSLIENVMLTDDRFLAVRSGRDALGLPRPVLQFCPVCLAAPEHPYFRRCWRLAHVVACREHGCRLHDRCWQCAKPVTPLAQRTTNPVACCASCGAVLAEAPSILSQGTRRQAALSEVLLYLATRIPAAERTRHLNALHRRLGPVIGAPVAERESAIAGLLPASVPAWFGPPVDERHAANLKMLAEGVSFDGLGIAARRNRATQRVRTKHANLDEAGGRRSKLPDYSDTARTLTRNLIEGQWDRSATNAFQGAQSADQNQ